MSDRVIADKVHHHGNSSREGSGRKALCSLCKEQLCGREAEVHVCGAESVSSWVNTATKESEMRPHSKGSRIAASILPFGSLALASSPAGNDATRSVRPQFFIQNY